MLDDLKMFGRYAAGLRGYLRSPLTTEQSRRVILQQREQREESLLRIFERGIYAQLRSPYRKLLEQHLNVGSNYN